MKRMNKVLAKAVVLSLIMGGVHMGGTFVQKAMRLRLVLVWKYMQV